VDPSNQWKILQVAFLASAVGPRVAAACAHASLEALSADNRWVYACLKNMNKLSFLMVCLYTSDFSGIWHFNADDKSLSSVLLPLVSGTAE
jgi:hypothetical protein